MSQHVNKNSSNLSIGQRRFITPNQLKTTNITNERQNNSKKEQLTNSGHQRTDKVSENMQKPGQKNNKGQVKNEYQGIQQSHNSRIYSKKTSLSRQKKDYMTANLAKLNHKRDKSTSSQGSQKGKNKNCKEQSIYTQQNGRLSQEYDTKNNISHLSSGSQSRTIEVRQVKEQKKISVPSQEEIAATQSVYLNFKEKAQQKNYIITEKKEISQVFHSLSKQPITLQKRENSVNFQNYNGGYQQYHKEQIIKLEPPNTEEISANKSKEAKESDTFNLKKQLDSDVTRLQMEMYRQKQMKYSEELLLRLKNQREEAAARLRKSEADKAVLQQKVQNMFGKQCQLEREMEKLRAKNIQLERQITTARQNVISSGNQINRQQNNSQRMFKELEDRYAALLAQYRVKNKSISDLNKELNAKDAIIQELNQSQRYLQETLKSKQIELDNMIKFHEAKIQEIQQNNQTHLKEMKLNGENRLSQQDERAEEIIIALKKQLNISEKERDELKRRVIKLEQQTQKIKSLQADLKAKETQNNALLNELNNNKNHILHLVDSRSQQLEDITRELREKQHIIQVLELQLEKLQRNQKSAELNYVAAQQLYGNTQNDQNLFGQMVRNQTEQTNKLRDDIFQKNEQIYKVQKENDQIRQRLRRLQQESQITSRTYNSNINNLQQARQAAEAVLKRQIQSLKRKVEAVEFKLRDRENQIAQKNGFIQKYIVGQSKKEDASSLVSRLEQLWKYQ